MAKLRNTSAGSVTVSPIAQGPVSIMSGDGEPVANPRVGSQEIK